MRIGSGRQAVPLPDPANNSYRPFIYVYDGDSLTDGVNQSYTNLQVNVDTDWDFRLRRFAGRSFIVPNTGVMQLKDPNGTFLYQFPACLPNENLYVPELLYPRGSTISFDVQGVARANWTYAVGGSVPNYYSQFCFQGVKVLEGVKPYQTDYPYYEATKVYRQTITIDYGGRIGPAYQGLQGTRQFSFVVEDYDFEVYRMSFLMTKNGASAPSVPVAAFKMQMYDQNRENLMSAPVVDVFINSLSNGYASCFPTPPLVYKVNSQIRYDIQSLLLDTEVPATLDIYFEGVNRIPCR